MHDYVMLWNAVALELNRRDHTGKMNAKNQRGPTNSSRALAMVHIAMHDAFFGRTGLALSSSVPGLQGPIATFLPVGGLAPPAATVANEGIAVSAAARAVLVELYPDFRPLVEEAWRDYGFNPADPAAVFGNAVGLAVLADRSTDGSDQANKAINPIAAYWKHREDPTDLGQGQLGRNWGAVRLFSATAIPPMNDHPVPRSTAYNRAHDQVRARGNKLLETGLPGGFGPRTPLQTLIGLFWAYDGASQIGTPPRLYNQIIRDLLARYIPAADRRAASARLLALVNVAMADAGIASWFYKYGYQLWRPVLGVREYDDSFWYTGTATSHGLHVRCDPWWVPFGAPRTNEPGRDSFTPPFPAYPSGHATFGAAAFEMVRLFLGVGANQTDSFGFDFVSDEMDGRAIAEDGSFRSAHRRHHDSLLRAMFDNSVSRVYLGVHWRFDGIDDGVKSHTDILTDTSKVGGVPLGRTLAQDIFAGGMTRSAAPNAVVVPIDLQPVP